MGKKMEITSAQNPKIKQLARLRNRRERDQTGTFLIEGYRELRRAVDKGVKIQTLYYCPFFFLGENEDALIERIGHTVAIFQCSEYVFKKISYRDRPDGLLAVAAQTHKTLSDLSLTRHAPLYLAAEAIEKPGNLGTILRSSDAVGVDGLLVCDACTDIYNPNVVRASVGTLFSVPVIEATSPEAIQWLRNHQVQILAATPHAKINYTEADLTLPTAIIIGTEQYGLSDQWLQSADVNVRIPMLGMADSLNAAMAATILLYEALRQRQRS